MGSSSRALFVEGCTVVIAKISRLARKNNCWRYGHRCACPSERVEIYFSQWCHGSLWDSRELWSLQEATTPMAFWSYASFSTLPSRYNYFQNICWQESKPHSTILLFEKVDSSILFIYIVLYHSSDDHVCTRGRATYLGNMLYTRRDVIFECAASPKIIPFHYPLSSLWKYYVCYQVQCWNSKTQMLHCSR